MKKVLLLSQNRNSGLLLHHFSQGRDWQVQQSGDIRLISTLLTDFLPDVIVIDSQLFEQPDFDDVWCRKLKSQLKVRILLLVSADQYEFCRQKIAPLCNDFLLNPWDRFVRELDWRLQSLADSPPLEASDELLPLCWEELSIDPISREVSVKGRLVTLTALEFDLLYCLASEPSRVWTREELFKCGWKANLSENLRLVDCHIGHIRQKMKAVDPTANWIQTVKGVGYRLAISSKNAFRRPSSARAQEHQPVEGK